MMLRSVRDQEYENWEILVIDQSFNAKAEIRDIVGDVKRGGLPVRLFYQETPNASRARNVGILAATGEILVFLDDDVEVHRADFLWNHARNYDAPEVGGVSGQIVSPDRTVRFDRHWMSRRPRVGWLYFPQNYGYRAWVESGRSANLSVRRSLAIAVGGMDERYEKGAHREEADFCWRCVRNGARFVFDPEASVVHHEEGTGGIRCWDDGNAPWAFHHLVGEAYFVLKNAGVQDYGDFIFVALRRHLLGSRDRGDVRGVARESMRLLRALIAARRWLRMGPKYLAIPAGEVGATEVL
jgi:glycosyltransferase involved in cell wall biosynthesis